MKWEGFLTTKFALWIDTHSSTNKIFHRSGRAVEKKGALSQIKKAPKAIGGDPTFHVFSLENTVTHISVTNPSSILMIQKYDTIKNDFERRGALLSIDLHCVLEKI